MVPGATGYVAMFDGGPGMVQKIAEVIERERHCCKFLRFGLQAEPNDGSIVLTVDGPPGTREFLDNLFQVA